MKDPCDVPRPQDDQCDIGAFESQWHSTLVYLPIVIR